MVSKSISPRWIPLLVTASAAAILGVAGVAAWQFRPEAHQRAVVQESDQALAAGRPADAMARLETLRQSDPAAADFYEGRLLARGAGPQSDNAAAARAALLLRRVANNATFGTRARLGLARLILAKPALAQSPTEGVELIRVLAEDGNKRAGVLLAERIAQQPDANKQEVLRLLARASETNGEAAATLLTMIDNRSLPVKSTHFVEDIRHRWFIYNLADARGGNVGAMVKVGDAYREGKGIAKDVPAARQWYDHAVALNSNAARLRQIELLQHDGTPAAAAKAHQLALAAAKQGGSIGALTELGRDFKDGRGTAADPVKAERYLRQASGLGSPSARFELADLLLKRQPESAAADTEALAMLTDAAKGGNAGAAATLSDLYEKGLHGVQADRVLAFNYLLQAAKGGRTGAQARLATRYFGGDDIVAHSEADAYRWAATAVNGGDQSPMLQIILADAYAHGDVVPKNLMQAKAYLETAVARGNVSAMRKLGHLYFSLQQSDASQNAVKWLRAAAAHGEVGAYVDLGNAYASGAGVPVDPNRAFAFFSQAAQAGNISGVVEMARSYATGYGVARDPVQAAALYQQAAQTGDVDAIILLSYCYEQGDGVPKSLPQARAWLLKGADMGDPEAEYWYGIYMLEGRGGPIDHSQGIEWLQKSSTKKFKAATAMLNQLMPQTVTALPAAPAPKSVMPPKPKTAPVAPPSAPPAQTASGDADTHAPKVES